MLPTQGPPMLSGVMWQDRGMSRSKVEPSQPHATLLRARQVLYRFASAAMADPRSGCVQALYGRDVKPLVAAAADLVRKAGRRCRARPAWGELHDSWLDPQRVLRRLPSSPEELNAEYERTFGLLVSSAHPPYEMEYVSGKLIFQRGHLLADVAGFYRAFGWRRSERHPERLDHLALELEFMAALCGQQVRARRAWCAARSAGNTVQAGVAAEQARVCWEAQQRFVAAHLAWWVPGFGRLLAAHRPRGFYAAAGRFVRAMMPLERALLHLPPASRPLQIVQERRPEECAGCLAAEVCEV